jgi:hypothetical protein
MFILSSEVTSNKPTTQMCKKETYRIFVGYKSNTSYKMNCIYFLYP